MDATRWVGPVRLDIEHGGLLANSGFHAYAVTATPSVGGRWRHEGAFVYSPTDQGFDRIAADVAAGVVLGALTLPETFGAEQTYLDLAELVESGAAHGITWPVRRAQHAVAVLVEVSPADAEAVAEDLPMRVEVVDRAIDFELSPASEAQAQNAKHALGRLFPLGVIVQLTEGLRGSLSSSDPESAGEIFANLLSSVRFSGRARVGHHRWEYSDGECRVLGWEELTTQVEMRFVTEDDVDATRLVEILADLSRRPDVADLDVDATHGGFHVLASVQKPMVFLEAVHGVLLRSGFRGAADLAAAGRWRFAFEGPMRLDHGVRV
jgi:hypothetical protein